MSDYPVLDNLPINKWKVAELREELKRRNLTTKGLKDELVRRLNEAICKEMEVAEFKEHKDDDRDIDPASGVEDTEPEPDPVKLADDVLEHPQDEFDDINGDVARASTKICLVEIDQNKVSDEVATGGTGDASGERKNSEAPVGNTSVINDIKSTDQFVEDKTDMEQEVFDSSQNNDVVDRVSGIKDVGIQDSSTGQDAVDMKDSSSGGVLENNLWRQENDVEVTPVTSKEALENSNIKLENEGLKLSGMDAESDMSNPGTQVYEVNPDLGSQIKSDSFSTINENKNLNDNLNADNVKLVTEVVRQEMELQSSSKDLSDVGGIHPLDDQTPHEMHGLVGETDNDRSSEVKFSMKHANADQVSVAATMVEHGLESNTSYNSEQKDVQFKKARTLGDVIDPGSSSKKIETSAEDKHCIAASIDDRKVLSKISDVVDGENMEKIKLDQSSADDSMEEDVVETKHVDFDHIFKEGNDKAEERITGMTEEPKVLRNGSSDAMQLDNPSEKVESPQETKDRFPVLSEKRKFQDVVGGGSKEPAKRQRSRNTEILRTAEPQNSSIALSENVEETALIKPVLGRTDSTVSEDAPKERVVPKSSKAATNSLKIENFVRPFTLKAVQELLARTGEVCSFWMDQIKTHCYVTYSSVEEAIETRNAVYNLQWPPKGGRLLVTDFVDPQQVQTRMHGREPPTPATNPSPSVPPASSSVQAPLARLQGRKQQVESEHPLTRPPPPAPPTAPPTKERLAPPVADKNDPPVITLDDLFRKTKAAPRIYYLPLTDEEVAKKLASRGDAKN
ncbi:putative 60S ribosomal protein L30-like [Capsicum annuum]|nr:putative 60S ribosomal protein L30-like [Capsicum annuum]